MSKKTSINVLLVVLVVAIAIGTIQFFRLNMFHQLVKTNVPSVQQQQFISTPNSIKKEGKSEIVLLGEKEVLQKGALYHQFSEAMKLAKKEYSFQKSLADIEPDPLQTVVLINESALEGQEEELRAFVRNGGNVFVAIRFYHPPLKEVFGMEKMGTYLQTETYGLTVKQKFGPLMETVNDVQGLIPNSALDIKLADDTTLYLEADGVPLYWTHQYGEGKIGYWNGTMLQGKGARGLLLQTLSLLPDKFVASQANMSVFYIDDFPAPIYEKDHAAITPYYHMNAKLFYRTIWWEQMKDLRAKFQLKYTNAFIGTYEKDTALTALELIEQNKRQFLYYGRDSLSLGDELALHGYNHQSMVKNGELTDPDLGYVPWESKESMVMATKRVLAMMNYYFPSYDIVTYVPPSNIIQETGIQALKEAIPGELILSSLYYGRADLGSYIQEFGEDKNNPDLFHLPRGSSGFVPSVYERRAYTDLLANAGIFSHFVHPDDLLDPDRNKGKIWDELYRSLEQNLETIYAAYPFLEGMTSKEAVEHLRAYEKMTIDVRFTDDSMVITGEDILSPTVLSVRLNDGTRLKEGKTASYEIVKIPEVDGMYAVKLTGSVKEIPLVKEKQS